MIEPLLHAERLLLHGQVDEAERIYTRTAAADPQNAIAVVGLARVALERGDDALAYHTACRALEIDPQNAAALRLEARLSEVLATRGEPVQRPAWVVGPGGQPAPMATRPPEQRADASSEPPPDLSAQAQRAAFTGNPSMADHRARMERRTPAPTQPAAESPRTSPTDTGPRRRSVIARLLGRG